VLAPGVEITPSGVVPRTEADGKHYLCFHRLRAKSFRNHEVLKAKRQLVTRYSGVTDKVVKTIRETRGKSSEIARALGIERAAVYQWKRVPPHWVQDVSRIIGVPPEKIRPDIFKRRKAKGN
jgi:hypothetical protein